MPEMIQPKMTRLFTALLHSIGTDAIKLSHRT